MSEQTWLLQSMPLLKIEGANLHDSQEAELSSLTVDRIKVPIDPDASGLPSNLLLFGVAAAAGMGNREIADRVHLSEATIKTHMNRLFEASGVVGRSALPRYFVENETFTFIEPRMPAPLGITPAQLAVLDAMSYGKQDKEIARDLGLNSVLAVKSRRKNMSASTGWFGRERLVLAGFATRTIGDLTLKRVGVETA